MTVPLCISMSFPQVVKLTSATLGIQTLLMFHLANVVIHFFLTLKSVKAPEADGAATIADYYTSICLVRHLLKWALLSKTPRSTDVQCHWWIMGIVVQDKAGVNSNIISVHWLLAYSTHKIQYVVLVLNALSIIFYHKMTKYGPLWNSSQKIQDNLLQDCFIKCKGRKWSPCSQDTLCVSSCCCKGDVTRSLQIILRVYFPLDWVKKIRDFYFSHVHVLYYL